MFKMATIQLFQPILWGVVKQNKKLYYIYVQLCLFSTSYINIA